MSEGAIPAGATQSTDEAAALGEPRPFVIEIEGWSRERYESGEPAPFSTGFYEFSHEVDFRSTALLYERTTRPLNLARVDDLPAIVQAQCWPMPGVRFEEHPILQPLDRLAGSIWGDAPFYSLEHGDFRRWTDDGRCERVLASDDGLPYPAPDREYCVDAAHELRRCFRAWTIGEVVESFDAWWETHSGVARAMLSDDEIAALRHALTRTRARPARAHARAHRSHGDRARAVTLASGVDLARRGAARPVARVRRSAVRGARCRSRG